MNHANTNRYHSPKRGQWLLYAIVTLFLAVGAGAATGLILEDSVSGISGSSSMTVGQTLAVTNVTAVGNSDAFFATIDDNQVAFSAHIEANNGDHTGLAVEITNLGGLDDVAFHFIINSQDAPCTFSISSDDANGVDSDGDGTVEPVVRIAPNTWVSVVGAGSTNTLYVSIDLSDTAPSGFYDISYEILPVNL